MGSYKPTAIDLFSGCGGLSVGLRKAGFRVVGAVERDVRAAAAYKLNHPRTLVLSDDIRKVEPTDFLKKLGLKRGELDLVAGCPPCQGFSSLRTLNGGKAVSEPMNDLVFEFVRFVEATRPKSVMLENVPGLADDHRLPKVISALKALGFNCKVDVFDAADFGVPQRRRRMILVGSRLAAPQFGLPAKRSRSVHAAIGKLPPPSKSDDPLHNYAVRRSPEVAALIRKIPKDGGSRRDLPEDAQLDCHKRCDGFSDIYGRMSWLGPAPTITGGCINPSKGRFLHPEQHRAITLREAAILQGFPENYKFETSLGRYPTAQLIGNAFPPGLAAKHAEQLKKQVLAARDKKRR